MAYRVLADVVMLAHFAFIAFVVVGGCLAWRWPRLLWLHVPTVLYGLVIATVGFVCPLTPLERRFRELAGDAGYEGGFVDHYIEDVIYPGRYTRLAQVLAAVVIVAGYVMVSRRRWAPHPAAGDHPAPPSTAAAKR